MKKLNKTFVLFCLSVGMGLSGSAAMAGGGGGGDRSYCNGIGAYSSEDCLVIEQTCYDNGGSVDECSGLNMSRCLYLCD
jgi:hypothetical protein